MYHKFYAALGTAVVTYTGQNIGAGKHDRISLGIKAAMKLSAAASVVLLVAFWLFGHPIMRAFVSNETMIAYAARILLAISLTTIPFIGMWGIWLLACGGIWLTTGLTWTIIAVFAFFRYKSGIWKSELLIQGDV